MSFTIRAFREEVKSLKMNKKGSRNTDIVDFLKVGLLMIIIVLILKALGFI